MKPKNWLCILFNPSRNACVFGQVFINLLKALCISTVKCKLIQNPHLFCLGNYSNHV